MGAPRKRCGQLRWAMEQRVRVASDFARPPKRRMHPSCPHMGTSFVSLARWSEISITRWWPGTAQAYTLAPPEVGSAAKAAMALDHGCSRATSCRTFTSGKTLPPWQIRPNPPNLFAPGTWKQTAHQPAVMLTARLWTPTGVACTDTTFFYNSLERKGNDRGHFVSEPISTVSLTESTGSWEGSTFSPRLMLICELKAKGNFYRPVAQEVCPWFAYSNDDGYLVKEAPPPPPMAPTASPPGPARDLDPFRGIWADPPAGGFGRPGCTRPPSPPRCNFAAPWESLRA